MSSYYKETKHPETGKWEKALWQDDYFGNHNYGVLFPSDNPTDNGLIQGAGAKGVRAAYDPRVVDLETRESGGTNEVKDKQGLQVDHKGAIYRITKTIECATGSDVKPEVCTNREIKADVLINTETGAVTIDRIMPSGKEVRGGNYTFIDSDHELARAIGEILIKAAELSEEVTNEAK